MSWRVTCPFCRSTPLLPLSRAEHTVRRGSYRRKHDGRRIQRFFCKRCRKTFSSLTGSPTWRQQKPSINHPLTILLCSGVAQRRAARYLKVDHKTVARRLPFLGNLAQHANSAHRRRRGPVTEADFDDMESSIHTKLKPVSIPMAVEKKSREIIAFRVCSMPPKGLLAEKSQKKYGHRQDDRPRARSEVLQQLAALANPGLIIHSDNCPQYPRLIKRVLPHARHIAIKGRRGCVAGQGELKKIGFDPLFSFNHTAASARANINRLFRKTWCISKRIDRLQDHIELYTWFHNHYLIKNPAQKKPPEKIPRLII
jgi:transposase-like protein